MIFSVAILNVFLFGWSFSSFLNLRFAASLSLSLSLSPGFLFLESRWSTATVAVSVCYCWCNLPPWWFFCFDTGCFLCCCSLFLSWRLSIYSSSSLACWRDPMIIAHLLSSSSFGFLVFFLHWWWNLSLLAGHASSSVRGVNMHAAGCVRLSRWSAAAAACCKHRCVSACPCACFLVGRPTTFYMLSSLMDASLRFFLRWQWKQEAKAASSFTSLRSTNEACCGGCCKVGRCKAFYNSTTVGSRGIRSGKSHPSDIFCPWNWAGLTFQGSSDLEQREEPESFC